MKKFINFFSDNIALTIVWICVIIGLIYSIKWALILYYHPEISYIDFKLYPYTHWKEYLPLLISVGTIIFIKLRLFLLKHKLNNKLKR